MDLLQTTKEPASQDTPGLSKDPSRNRMELHTLSKKLPRTPGDLPMLSQYVRGSLKRRPTEPQTPPIRPFRRLKMLPQHGGAKQTICSSVPWSYTILPRISKGHLGTPCKPPRSKPRHPGIVQGPMSQLYGAPQASQEAPKNPRRPADLPQGTRGSPEGRPTEPQTTPRDLPAEASNASPARWYETNNL